MAVAIVGHSFVRRLKFDMKRQDITLEDQGRRVHMVGIGGATIKGKKTVIPPLVQFLKHNRCELVILDVGSNDLDLTRHPTRDLDKLAQDYVRCVDKITTRHPNLQIIICLPIPRLETKFPGSRAHTSNFNTILKTLTADLPRVHTWAHKGLFKSDSRFLMKDGVHLNAKGSVKYYHSLKAAIHYYSYYGTTLHLQNQQAGH